MNKKDLCDVPNLVGIIAGNEFSISQLIDLSYKGSQQEGMPILMFNTREELEEVCKNFGISIWDHPLCVYCDSVIRGVHTIDEKGAKCFDCENTTK